MSSHCNRLNNYDEESLSLAAPNTDQPFLVKTFKERKKHDRFNGMPEEEVSKRTLPDHLSVNLDIVIVSAQLNIKSSNLAGSETNPNSDFDLGVFLFS